MSSTSGWARNGRWQYRRRLTRQKGTRMSNHIFNHFPDGEKFAVQMNSKGEIIGASGPLHYSEFAAVLAGDWDSDAEMTEMFQGFDYIEEGYSDVTDDIRHELAIED